VISRRRLISTVIPVILLGGLASGFLVWSNRSSFKTEPAHLGSINFTVTANGKLASSEQVEVGPKVGGLVSEMLVEEGDIVTAGQVLARLDDQELKARLRQASSAVEQARTTIEVAQVQLAQSKDQLARVQRLFDSGVAPRAELEDGQHAVNLRAAQLRTASAAHQEAEASLGYIRTQLANTVVLAPLNGRVIAKHHERGRVVPAADPLYTIADSTNVIVRAEVDETDAGKVKIGMPAAITSDAFPGRKITGTIDKIAWRVGRKRVLTDNPAEMIDTKVLEAEIPIAPDPQLRIGMAMDVKISTGQKDKALLISRSAVQRRGQDILVLVVKDGKVEERPIQLGAFEGQIVEVTAGLKAGEAVVVGKD